MPRHELPPIRWGAATSAYQVEGAIHAHGRGPSIWDAFCERPGAIDRGETGELACDHLARLADDVALMSELGLQAYRFSISWPRVVPDGVGDVSSAGLDVYDELVDRLLAAGIEPWVTLYHWDLPLDLEHRGGWPQRATAEHFARFAQIVAERLGDRVTNWLTINEPWVASALGYRFGLHAPGRSDLGASLQAAHTMLLGHGLACDAVRAAAPGARMGIVLDQSPAIPHSESPEDVAAAHRYDGYHTRWFLDPIHGRGYPQDIVDLLGADAPHVRDGDLELIARPLDVLGVNYYSPAYVADAPDELPLRTRVTSGQGGTVAAVSEPGERERTDLGWLVEPSGLHDVLDRIHREYAPASIAITENGAVYDDPDPVDGRVADPARTSFLQRHVEQVERARTSGVPVEAYFAWSLLDNFEWAQGYAPRFGIVHVDRSTLDRTVKDSGRWYAGHIAATTSQPRNDLLESGPTATS